MSIQYPRTVKEKNDWKARGKAISKRRAKNDGGIIACCSNCKNKVRLHEAIGDRMIQCSKCNTGFYK